MLPIDLFFIGAAQQVIHADIVKVGQGAKHLWWQHPAATFVIGVGALRHIDGRTHLAAGSDQHLPAGRGSFDILSLRSPQGQYRGE